MNKPFPHSPEGTGNYVSHLDKLAVTLAVYITADLFPPKQMREFEERPRAALWGRTSTINRDQEGSAFLQGKEKELPWKGGRRN